MIHLPASVRVYLCLLSGIDLKQATQRKRYRRST
jgi:hypothetical protein